MGNEQWFCLECEARSYRPVLVNLDRHLRCELCGSESVISAERVWHGGGLGPDVRGGYCERKEKRDGAAMVGKGQETGNVVQG